MKGRKDLCHSFETRIQENRSWLPRKEPTRSLISKSSMRLKNKFKKIGRGLSRMVRKAKERDKGWEWLCFYSSGSLFAAAGSFCLVYLSLKKMVHEALRQWILVTRHRRCRVSAYSRTLTATVGLHACSQMRRSKQLRPPFFLLFFYLCS